ncbi:MAG: phage portal protein [Frankiaceae bacterium]
MGIFLGGRERRSVGGWSGEPPIPPYPGAAMPGASGVGGGLEAAMIVPTVWACVSKLANAVSMLPLEAFRATAGIPTKLTPGPSLLTTPAAGMTQSEWLHMLMVSLLLRGNAYGRIVQRDTLQRPSQIELLNPDNVTVKVDKDTGQARYFLAPKQVDITADMWHVRGMTVPGAKVGLSPIAFAMQTLSTDVASRQFASDFFSGGGIPKAVITSDQVLSQDQARTMKDRIMAATRSREPLVLPLGIKYQGISVSPDESQFLQTQQANINTIAGYFGVPPEMVGGSRGSSLTYSSTEMQGIEFLTYGVAFWLKRIEDAFFPLLPQPQFVRFNTAALLRTDAKTQAEVDNMQLAGKTRVGSELRRRDGLPPFTPEQKDEADMTPLTVTPNGGAKALPALKTPPGPEATVPADDSESEPANV